MSLGASTDICRTLTGNPKGKRLVDLGIYEMIILK
jgi:hypothetical protein